MDKEPTKDEVDRRARELARRVMEKAPEPQAWPGRPKPKKAPGGDAKPRKRGPTASAS